MWFVQIQHIEHGYNVEFVIDIKDDLNALDDYIEENYPEYCKITLVACYQWKGEVKIG